MHGKKVVIVGGSISGCTVAVLLQRLGMNVNILERSSGSIHHGSGITLPVSVVEQCIALDLFDTNIPRLTVSSRSFSRKENDQKKTFWRQSINAVALNWLHVYKNLRARIQPDNYHEGTD